jgi:NADPH-dependent ferric siderophore reductase
MSDLSDPTERRRFPPGFDPGAPRRPPLTSWSLTVIGQAPVTPRMLRVRFTGAELESLIWRPGQDLVLSLPQAGGSLARRHYTINDFNRAEQRLDIDFVLHGDSPAVRWARSAKPGEVIEAQGPRGRTTVAAEVERHLFCGDETCIPAIFAMARSLPAQAKATALIEVGGPAEVQTLSAQAGVNLEWLYRNGAPPGPSTILLDRLTALRPSSEGAHAYVIGETSNVRAQRHYLLEQGFDRSRITAEGYWRPGRVGGHDHV